MPYITNWPPKRSIALAAASLSLLVAASPAAADMRGGPQQPQQYQQAQQYQQYQPSAPSPTCPISLGAPVFSAFGDLNNYALLAGGSFQAPLTGWALNGASVVPGGEPWNVSGSISPQSLSLPAGSYAVSPTFCLTSQLPSWRFFAEAATGSDTQLQVTALYSLSDGRSGQITATTLNSDDYSSWEPTSSLPLGSVLPAGETANVRFVFSPSNGGAWNVDDVYIDPYAR